MTSYKLGQRNLKNIASRCTIVFEDSWDKEPTMTFLCLRIVRSVNGTLFIDQNFNLKKLEVLELDSNFGQFRSIRIKVSWLSNPGPDIEFEVSQLK